jgi:hypothetical protein
VKYAETLIEKYNFRKIKTEILDVKNIDTTSSE